MNDENKTVTETESVTTTASPAPETAGPLGNVTDAVTGRASEVEVEKTVETVTESTEDASDSAT